MSWWKFGRRKRETIEASWLGEKIAEILDPSSLLNLVQKWHDFPPDDPRAFVAVASLRIAGFYIGSNQKSVASRVDAQVIVEVCHSIVGTLIDKSMPHDGPKFRPYDRLAEIWALVDKLTETFYANAQSKPTPHWYVGKEVCQFLLKADGVPNPEDVMVYADYLSESMRTTKQLLDELLDANVLIVQSKKNAV